MAANLTTLNESPNAGSGESNSNGLFTARILHVEDNTDIGDMVAFVLAREGYQVVTARTCRETLELITERLFDLYLIDNVLPDGSGAALSLCIRAVDAENPIIFCSAWDSRPQSESARDYSAAQGYLMKPFSMEDLVGTVSRLLKTACGAN